MAKMSGWQKAGLIAGVGCASVVLMLVIGIAVAVFWARSTLAELGEGTPVRSERTIALSPSPSEPASAATPPAAPRSSLRLTMDLQEADVTLRPGAPGSDVKVDGTWAPELYELTENQQTDPDGTRRAAIRFRSKAPGWARALAGMFGDARHRATLTVLLPRETPMELTLRVGMGESRMDLGGLALSDLDLDLSMGDHRVTFAEPVAESVRRLRLNASMGNVEIENVGNTRAQVVDASGSMGNLSLDLSGPWKSAATTELSIGQSMGELTVRIPSTVRLETSFQTSMGDASNQAANAPQPEDPNAPVLRMKVATSMGETRIVRY